MTRDFVRTGALKDPASYPQWAQDLMQSSDVVKREVLEHPLWPDMREGRLDPASMRNFMAGIWPVIEQFPRYMAMSLLKTHYGRSRGETMARRWLVRNIRIEQNHADYWLDWADAAGVPRAEVMRGAVAPETQLLSHWCWQVCHNDSLAAGIIATNFAVEGTTGEGAVLVTQDDIYAYGFDARVRAKAMRWLTLHADYDDSHPWEALDIVCTLKGNDPAQGDVEHLRQCVVKSYTYMRASLDHCYEHARVERKPVSVAA